VIFVSFVVGAVISKRSLSMMRFVSVLVAALFVSGGTAPAQEKKAAANPVVVMETSMGTITIELDQAKAPVSVENFLRYARDGHYSGTIFHRVIPGFMIQGGGFTPDMRQKPTRPPIQNEATNKLSNVRGTIAMARTPEIRSATSQFFINVADNRRSLDHRGLTPDDYGYAVFGKVIAGMEVADKIVKVPTTTKGTHGDVPVEPVVIKAVRIK
jgi:cyclophilin family peptidyl-prolyl cis-trans isomerase